MFNLLILKDEKSKFLSLTILLWCISMLLTMTVDAAEQQVRKGFLADLASIDRDLIIPHIKSLNQRPNIDPKYVSPSADEVVVVLDQQLVVVDRNKLQKDISNGFVAIDDWFFGSSIFDTFASAGAEAVTLKQAMGNDIIAGQLADGVTWHAADSEDLSSQESSSSDRVVVIVDGILMELPYSVVIGMIRNGTFIVQYGSWTIDLTGDVGEVDCERQIYHPLCLPPITFP